MRGRSEGELGRVLRVPKKSLGKRLRVRVDDKIRMTLEKMRTGFLLGPC
jgi:hypothetical protein